MRSNCTCSVRKASRTMGGVVWGDRSERFSSAQGRNVREDRKRIQLAQLVLVAHLESSSSATNAAVAPMVNPASKASPIRMAALVWTEELGGVARWVREKAGSPDLWIARRRSSRSASSPAASPCRDQCVGLRGQPRLDDEWPLRVRRATLGQGVGDPRRIVRIGGRGRDRKDVAVALRFNLDRARDLLCVHSGPSLRAASAAPSGESTGSPPSGRCASVARVRAQDIQSLERGIVGWQRRHKHLCGGRVLRLADDDPGDARRQGRQDHRNDEASARLDRAQIGRQRPIRTLGRQGGGDAGRGSRGDWGLSGDG